ncbi:MAG: IPT/TIG domain-containing protein [Legionellaceae bacterium]|nr:IPT/TIG domain-containing protein [Legionellaceae bacterium]
MKTGFIVTRLLCSLVMLCLLSAAQASSPVWTLTPLTATTLTVPSNDTAVVQYQITNRSSRAHVLAMQAITGVTQLTTGLGVCGNPFSLTEKGSCTLSLQINGSQLTGPILNGPVVCRNNSVFECYRPARGNNLHITQVETGITLSSVSPNVGEASGGTGVTLTGVGLTDTTGVTFGGIAASSVAVLDSTTVTAVTPAHAVGAVDVVIRACP